MNFAPFYFAYNMGGFIKSTNHRLTDHLPTDHRPTYPPTHRSTDHRPTDPPTHRPTDKFIFKRLENMKTFILQNVNTAGKIESYTSAYYLFE